MQDTGAGKQLLVNIRLFLSEALDVFHLEHQGQGFSEPRNKVFGSEDRAPFLSSCKRGPLEGRREPSNCMRAKLSHLKVLDSFHLEHRDPRIW